MNNSNSIKFDKLLHLLNEIKNKGNLDGIIFAYRDGRVISENLGVDLNSKNFTSMCATVLESAGGIGETIGNQKIKKIIAELEEKTILIIECTNSTFFILIIHRKSNITYIMSKLKEIIQKGIKM